MPVFRFWTFSQNLIWKPKQKRCCAFKINQHCGLAAVKHCVLLSVINYFFLPSYWWYFSTFGLYKGKILKGVWWHPDKSWKKYLQRHLPKTSLSKNLKYRDGCGEECVYMGKKNEDSHGILLPPHKKCGWTSTSVKLRGTFCSSRRDWHWE